MTDREVVVHTWQLQEAKNKFSKVVDNAIHDGPQVIAKDGTEVAVVLSVEEYRRLTTPPKKLSDFFQDSPLAEAGLDLSRDESPIRSDDVL